MSMTNEQRLAVLKEIEYAGCDGYEGEISVCPSCNGVSPIHARHAFYPSSDIGHAHDCVLAQMIKELEDEPDERAED